MASKDRKSKKAKLSGESLVDQKLPVKEEVSSYSFIDEVENIPQEALDALVDTIIPNVGSVPEVVVPAPKLLTFPQATKLLIDDLRYNSTWDSSIFSFMRTHGHTKLEYTKEQWTSLFKTYGLKVKE